MKVYEELKAEYGEEWAKNHVAIPGTSEHHTGLAIDFNSVEDSFENTKMYKWLDKNAQDYGFICPPPDLCNKHILK